ncbi:MAG: TIR domain-containing protein [Paludibacteraceae bacterium]|nr:TIR domain-containing protein [Paludibacteraceae bacterium]
MKYDIFISYRREGGRDFARQVELALKSHGYHIFFDYNSIRNGVFNTQIIDAINGCKDFILILSEGSMERCVNEDDWVAKEIRTAISAGCNIIPLIVGSFADFPVDFPNDLRILRNIQRSQLMTDEYFNASIDLLKGRLASKSNSANTQIRNSSTDTKQFHLELKTNEDCKVFIDDEEREIADTQDYKKELKKNNTLTVKYDESGLMAAYLETDCIKFVTFSNGKKTLPATLVYKNGLWMFEDRDVNNLDQKSNKTYSSIVFDIPHLIFSKEEDIKYLAQLYNIQTEETIYGDLKLNIDEQLYSIQDIIVKYIELFRTEIEHQIGYTFDTMYFISPVLFDIKQMETIGKIASKACLKKIRVYDNTLATSVFCMRKKIEETNHLMLDIHKTRTIFSIINSVDHVFEVKYLNEIHNISTISETQIKDDIELALRESELANLDIKQIFVLNTSLCQSFSSTILKNIFPNSEITSCSSEDAIKGGCLIACCIEGYANERTMIMPLQVIAHSITIATQSSFATIIPECSTIPTKRSIKLKNSEGQEKFLIKLYSTLPFLSDSEYYVKRKMFAQYGAYLEKDTRKEYTLYVGIDALYRYTVELCDGNGKKITLHKENYNDEYLKDLPEYSW